MVAIRHDAADHGSLCGSACSCAGGDRQRAVTERENGAAGSGDEGPLPVTTSLTITGNAGARTATLDHLQRLRHAERRRSRNWTRRQRLQQHPRRHLQRLLTGARPGCADRKQARSGRRASGPPGSLQRGSRPTHWPGFRIPAPPTPPSGIVGIAPGTASHGSQPQPYPAHPSLRPDGPHHRSTPVT